MQTIQLFPGKDRAILHHHHWLFSEATNELPSEIADGSLVRVENCDGKFLGIAYVNRRSNIIGRMISFDDQPIADVLRQKIRAAILLRKSLFDTSQTNAFRLINSEGDQLPGLVLDKYADVLVLQSTTLGMDKLKPVVLSILQSLFPKASIFEHSDSPVRKTEGIPDVEAWLAGTPQKETQILENGLKLLVKFDHPQQYGQFLDQREMRALVRQYAKGRKVMSGFAFNGAFSVAALAGGATQAVSVDSSALAGQLATQNATLNNFSATQHHATTSDVFKYLTELRAAHDFVILDPPALAPKKLDVPGAIRRYRDLNRLALSKLPPRSLLLTCSSSYHLEPELFQKILFQAALETHRNVQILERHRLALDHPVNIYHPEGEYLKSLFLAVE